MKKVLIFALFVILMLGLRLDLVSGIVTIVNPDKPLKGHWDLRARKVWQLKHAGADVFSRVEMAAAQDGSLYVHDWRNRSTYRFDNNGVYKGKFGTGGEGPGEIRSHLKTFIVKGKIVAAAVDRLHYFTPQGKFIKSVTNRFFQWEPQVFINDSLFIAAPSFVVPEEGKGRIALVNLNTGTKKTIGVFSLPKTEAGDKGVKLIGLSPMIITGYDYDNSKLYYGVNDRYEIHTIRLNGQNLNKFSLSRPEKIVAPETLRRQIRLIDASAPINKIIKKLPRKITYFHRISIHNGFVLVFAGNFGLNWESQGIDIFSLDGRYLYRTEFIPGPGEKIYYVSQGNVIIEGNNLYVVLEKDDGDVAIAKYHIQLPG